jgi:hydrogenase maturation protein HypF
VLTFRQSDDVLLNGGNALNTAIKLIESGGIIAVKGIGGYHLCCSPYIESTVKRLRQIKFREAKPFAVMFRDVKAVQDICALSEKEQSLLASPAKPIVLLSVINNVFAPSVLGNNDICGCFLPYTPLHRLIVEELGEIILTSANLSGSAIVLKDEEMLAFAEHTKIDGVLFHNREIIRSAEDSVCQMTQQGTQILRRSRGYAPGSFALSYSGADFLAMGGDLKSSFAVVKNNRACISQYFGDLEDISSQKAYTDGISDFFRLYRTTPKFVVCDMHPDYFSSALAEIMAANIDLPLIAVQHHHAHAASVMAEHNLPPDSQAIAVVFDGMGYGEDGTIWGGEFFVWQEGRFIRRGHLKYVDILGADSAAVYADKTALCYLDAYNIGPPDVLKKDLSFVETVKSALKNKINVYQYSGAGRLFDALAAITGISMKNQYEGECAAMFEKAARLSHDLNFTCDFNITCENGMYIADPVESFRLAVNLPCDKIPAFAYGFHLSLSRAIEKIVISLSEETGIRIVLLSGGVFQNRLLSELTVTRLKKAGLMAFQNLTCPPNDNGLCLGQAYFAGQMCGNNGRKTPVTRI